MCHIGHVQESAIPPCQPPSVPPLSATLCAASVGRPLCRLCLSPSVPPLSAALCAASVCRPLCRLCRPPSVPPLSAALCVASAHDFHPNTSRTFSTIRHHVSFGLPIDLFPTGVQFINIRQSFVFSNRRIWPIKLHRLALMMSVILLISTSSYRFSFEM